MILLSPPISPPRPAIEVDVSQSEYEGFLVLCEEERGV
jgi:hypothetical protein